MLQLHQIHLSDWILSNIAPDFRLQAFRFYFVFPVCSCYLLRWSAWSNDFKWQWNQAKQLHHSSCVAWQILMSCNHKDRFVDIFGIVYHNRKTSCFVAWACALHHWRSFVLLAWWQVCRCSLHLGENAFLAKFKCSCWSWRWCWRLELLKVRKGCIHVCLDTAGYRLTFRCLLCHAAIQLCDHFTSAQVLLQLQPPTLLKALLYSKARHAKKSPKTNQWYLEKWRFVLHLLLLISMS